MPDWTTYQTKAIENKNKTILVSAAAGSGKTAVLTERIIRKIVDKDSPLDINRMLIVTFTKLAAEELKQRIISALEKKILETPTEKRYTKQLSELQNTQISTIDAFFLKIVKDNYASLSLPSSFRLGDDGELLLLSKTIMDECIEKKYDESRDDFPTLIECISSEKKSNEISDTLIKFYTTLEKLPDGIKVIKKFADEIYEQKDNEFKNTKFGQIILQNVIECSNDYLSDLKKFYNNEFQAYDEPINKPICERYIAYLEDLIEIAKKGDIDALKTQLSISLSEKLDIANSNLQKTAISIFAQIKKELTALPKHLLETYFSFNPSDLKYTYERMSKVLNALYDLYSDYEKALYDEKVKRHIFSFSDIVRFTLKLLRGEDGKPTEIAEKLREEYDEIYVDEYQDVDPVQDLIFTLIAKPTNRFMVGDIKQSIYGFKGSDTKIFANYKAKFSRDEKTADDNLLIYMPDNFRSDKPVIDFANMCFSKIFQSLTKSIGYNSAEDDLCCSKVIKNQVFECQNVSLAIIEKNFDEENKELLEDYENAEIEAKYIANKIQYLLKNGRNDDGSKIRPSDIAVLVRKTKHINYIYNELNALNIPCINSASKDLFDTPSVLLMLSLLETINNPTKDIPLCSVLISPIFNFTLDDILTVKNADDKESSLFDLLIDYKDTNDEIASKIVYFEKKLNQYRKKAIATPINKLLDYLYRDLSIFSYSADEKENLIKLYEMARTFEGTSFKGLDNFVDYVENLIEKSKQEDSKEIDSESDTVKIMTIHKSKGLEFNVVFVAFLGGKLNGKNNLLNYNSVSGISIPILHKDGFLNVYNPISVANSLQNHNDYVEEEMRILYVALTRAKEKLYLSGTILSKSETFKTQAAKINRFPSEYKYRNVANYLLAIDSTIEKNCDFVDVEYVKQIDIINEIPDIFEKEAINKIEQKSIEELKSILSSKIDFEYKKSYMSDIKSKFSVSKIYPSVLDDNEFEIDDNKIDEELISISDFLKEAGTKATSAEIGTATHLFMQFCDFNNAENNGVCAEIKRLCEKGFITKKIADIISVEQLEKFFKSDFYKQIKSAKTIYREQRFNILMNADEFTANDELKEKLKGESILVQGVIDLFYIDNDGNITLCDYKTDYIDKSIIKDMDKVKEFLSERHKTQLSYYKKAISMMLKKEPSTVCIYSLPLGEAVEIET